ncbi:MAG: PAS domain S-box protein [Gemmatimonadota bacterium]|nr:MAG: PAS domain S-box protein [Gemmatimonadota bacterium]
MDEKSKGSWVAGLPARGSEARFESQMTGAGEQSATGPEAGESAGGDHYLADIVFIVKQDGTVLYLNREVSDLAGGAPGTSVLDYTASEQHDLVRGALDQVFATGEPQGYECQGTEPFAADAWYQCRVAANRREGKVVSATIIARDVSSWKSAQSGLKQERDRLKSEYDTVSGELERLRGALAQNETEQQELDRFRAIMDQAGEAIFITDPETGRFVDANETACRWLGFRKEKLLTLGIGDLDLEFPLESPNGVPEHVTNTRGSPRPKLFSEGRHRRRNGTSFPVEVAINRRLFGDKTYMLVVARDIKERGQAQQALRESEDKFRSLFELSRDAIYLSARDGSVADVNDAAVDLFGYTRAEFLELEARRLYVRPDDIRTFQKGVDESGSVKDMQIEFLTKQGQRFRGLLTATLRHDGDGSILGYQCIISPETQATPEPEAESAEPEGAVRVEKDSVLVVDSDKRILVEVREVLERAGITVLTARTGAAAIQVYKSESAAVGAILLGDNDEEMDAATTIRQLESVDRDVAVVLMTDSLEGADDARRAELGASDIVTKPVHPLALVQHVRDALASQESP